MSEFPTFKISSPVSLRGNIRKTFGLNKEIEIKALNRTLNHNSPIQFSGLPVKNWKNELADFSWLLARDANVTLDRIKDDFKHNGMKFGPEFRNHFMHIVNNR